MLALFVDAGFDDFGVGIWRVGREERMVEKSDLEEGRGEHKGTGGGAVVYARLRTWYGGGGG